MQKFISNAVITKSEIDNRLADLFAKKYLNDECTGTEHEGVYEFLEEHLFDVQEYTEVEQDWQSRNSSANSLEGTLGVGAADVLRKQNAAGYPHSSSPDLLTRGFPCNFSSEFPQKQGENASQEFSSVGYDGGVTVGIDGRWESSQFSELVEWLESAKEKAIELCKDDISEEGYVTLLHGVEVIVFPKGGVAGGDGGLNYKYRFKANGVEFLIHSSPSKNIQPVRLRYGAESIQGNRQKLFDVHFGFVCPFLDVLGLTITGDKPSRVDMQCLIDVEVDQFVKLIRDGHVVTKLRKKSEHGTMSRVETVTIGSINSVQICFYDKAKELRSHRTDVLKEAIFIRDVIGEEWYKSGKPVTRIEVRLGRDALKAMSVNTMRDLQEMDNGIIDMITERWFRILEKPKVRGTENDAKIHFLWNRVRNIFFSSFTGMAKEVSWRKRESISCDPVALEKQALGCLAKSFSLRYGKQDKVESVNILGNFWFRDQSQDMIEKINKNVRVITAKSGVVISPVAKHIKIQR